jgi:HK97 family phage major capsid protein
MAGEDILQKHYRSPFRVLPGQVQKAAMGETSGAVGGYLVPTDFTNQLLQAISENSFIYPRAHVIPMRSLTTECPKVDAETAQSAATSPFFGGLIFKWGTSQAPSETEPKFRSDPLTAWDLLGYATVSNDWLEDANTEGEDHLLKLFGMAAAWYLEYAFLQGTGTSNQMPLGIINAPAAKTVSRHTPSQILQVDIANMAAAMLPFSWKNAIWASSPACVAQLIQVANFFLNVEANDEGGQVGSLLTRPVFITEKLSTLGSLGDLIFFDPWLYVVGMRQEVLIDADTLGPAFKTNQTDFRVWLRADGKPQVQSAITLQDGTTMVSPYIILK